MEKFQKFIDSLKTSISVHSFEEILECWTISELHYKNDTDRFIVSLLANLVEKDPILQKEIKKNKQLPYEEKLKILAKFIFGFSTEMRYSYDLMDKKYTEKAFMTCLNCFMEKANLVEQQEKALKIIIPAREEILAEYTQNIKESETIKKNSHKIEKITIVDLNDNNSYFSCKECIKQDSCTRNEGLECDFIDLIKTSGQFVEKHQFKSFRKSFGIKVKELDKILPIANTYFKSHQK